MDNQKILLVNLSKGMMGEQAAKLLGMVFVMKFQAAAMSRADTPEDQRKDFCLYVDEFQNFATDSFESILSEARKYRLNLVLANQFMTQLTDRIKGAIIGNVPTKIVGRIGIDDAESLQRAFVPTFTAEDLTKLPNYHAITTVLINGIPSAPFTMRLLPPLGKSNPELRNALKKYSASKYGRPKAIVEAEIRDRLSVNKNKVPAPSNPQFSYQEPKQVNYANPILNQANIPAKKSENIDSNMVQRNNNYNNSVNNGLSDTPDKKSFLDDWLDKREKMRSNRIDNGPIKQSESVRNNALVINNINNSNNSEKVLEENLEKDIRKLFDNATSTNNIATAGSKIKINSADSEDENEEIVFKIR